MHLMNEVHTEETVDLPPFTEGISGCMGEIKSYSVYLLSFGVRQMVKLHFIEKSELLQHFNNKV